MRSLKSLFSKKRFLELRVSFQKEKKKKTQRWIVYYPETTGSKNHVFPTTSTYLLQAMESMTFSFQ